MMKDRQRVGFYYRAMTRNPDLFKGKTVLDVGSGLGILSLFAGILFKIIHTLLMNYELTINDVIRKDILERPQGVLHFLVIFHLEAPLRIHLNYFSTLVNT